MSTYSDLEGSGHWASVTTSDTTDLPGGTCRGLYVGVSGHVAVVTECGDSVTLQNVVAGLIHSIKLKRIRATGTTATGIVVCY